jgi:hypothetical protein
MNKNKLKLVLAICAVLVFGLSATAVLAADQNYTADVIIVLTGSQHELTIKSGSETTSLVVGTNSIDVVVPISSALTIESRNELTLTGAGGATNTAQSCTGSVNTLVITTGAGSTGTYTITPADDECGDGGGGGGGGGGGSSSDDSDSEDTATPAPSKPISEMTPAELQAEITRILALIAQLQAQLPGVPAAPFTPAVCSAAFTGNLSSGMANSQGVKNLQDFLISKGHLAAGYNTGNYYALTVNAVKAYQTSKGPRASLRSPATLVL